MRIQTVTALAAGSLLLAGCAKPAEESGMAGMSAEDHAKMMAGGTQGTVDSTGVMMRQPVHLTTEQERALGVVYTTVTRESLSKSVRTVGTIQTPEPNIVEMTTKIEGFVEKLYVNTTGASVRRGEPLLAIYSPALVAAQQEILTARRLVGQLQPSAGEAWQNAQATLDAARRRLAYWDVSEGQIAELERSGSMTRTLTLASPADGIVLDKSVFEGQRVMPGQRLYQIADLSQVWVEGEVFEQDLALVKLGMQVHIEIAAHPGEHLMGQVSFIYPVLDAVSRTNRVRITVPNPARVLKPGMFATIFFDANLGRDIIVVPRDAVVVTGVRNIVFVCDSDGMLQPREVVLGERSGDRVHVLSGLTVGERIVASANFLVDAESRLGGGAGMSSMPGLQHAVPGGTPTPASKAPAKAPMKMPMDMPMGQGHD